MGEYMGTRYSFFHLSQSRRTHLQFKMKIVIVIALIAAVAAAPAELETKAPVAIIRSASENNADGSYSFSFETEDGTKVEESGSQKLVDDEEEEDDEDETEEDDESRFRLSFTAFSGRNSVFLGDIAMRAGGGTTISFLISTSSFLLTTSCLTSTLSRLLSLSFFKSEPFSSRFCLARAFLSSVFFSSDLIFLLTSIVLASFLSILVLIATGGTRSPVFVFNSFLSLTFSPFFSDFDTSLKRLFNLTIFILLESSGRATLGIFGCFSSLTTFLLSLSSLRDFLVSGVSSLYSFLTSKSSRSSFGLDSVFFTCNFPLLFVTLYSLASLPSFLSLSLSRSFTLSFFSLSDFLLFSLDDFFSSLRFLSLSLEEVLSLDTFSFSFFDSFSALSH